MYRQGLGDCFLVTFFTGHDPVHMLIDCGSIGEQTTGVKLDQVGADIVAATQGHLAMLIATHEHQDHLNGFLRNKAIFDPPGFAVDRVWQAWTEDKTDDLAQDLQKYKNDLVNAVALASTALEAQTQTDPDATGVEDARSLNHSLRGLLEFAGAPPAGTPLLGAAGLSTSVDDAMDWVTKRASNSDKFLSPGTVLQPAWLPGVRVYVLGPPRDKKQINTLGTHGDPNLYELTAQATTDFATCVSFASRAHRSRNIAPVSMATPAASSSAGFHSIRASAWRSPATRRFARRMRPTTIPTTRGAAWTPTGSRPVDRSRYSSTMRRTTPAWCSRSS